MELKEQLKQELLDQKEQHRKKEIEENSKLTGITLYVRKNPGTEKVLKNLTEMGIKFDEKDINLYPKVTATVSNPSPLIVKVNSHYLIMGRDFQDPKGLVPILKHLGNPDYEAPDPDEYLIETIKNVSSSLHKQLSQIQRQLQPIVRVMNELAQEEAEEKKENAVKKNK